MNKVAHYNGFVGRCQQYGLTKQAADMLYKQAKLGPAKSLISKYLFRPASRLGESSYAKSFVYNKPTPINKELRALRSNGLGHLDISRLSDVKRSKYEYTLGDLANILKAEEKAMATRRRALALHDFGEKGRMGLQEGKGILQSLKDAFKSGKEVYTTKDPLYIGMGS